MLSLVLTFILVILDRVFKVMAENLLSAGNTVVVLPGILGFSLLEGGNTGAAFGIFSGKTGILAGVSVICSVIMLWILVKKKFTSSLSRFSLILICAGAIGNLYDRIVYSRVTDYIEFLFIDFPIFNFADCLVVVGAVLMVMYVLIWEKDDPFFISEKITETESEDAD